MRYRVQISSGEHTEQGYPRPDRSVPGLDQVVAQLTLRLKESLLCIGFQLLPW